MEDKKRTFLYESGDADGASTSKMPRLDPQGYDRCRKPFGKSDKKCSSKSLRKVSANQVEIFNAKFTATPPLSCSGRICYKCRRMIDELCKTPESSESKFYQFT